MVFCNNCGKQIRDNSVFCEFCGAPVGEANSPLQSGGVAAPPVAPPIVKVRQERKPISKKTKASVIAAGIAVVVIAIAVGIFASNKYLFDFKRALSNNSADEASVIYYNNVKDAGKANKLNKCIDKYLNELYEALSAVTFTEGANEEAMMTELEGFFEKYWDVYQEIAEDSRMSKSLTSQGLIEKIEAMVTSKEEYAEGIEEFNYAATATDPGAYGECRKGRLCIQRRNARKHKHNN